MQRRYGQKERPRVLVSALKDADADGLVARFRMELGLKTVQAAERDTYLPEWDCIVGFETGLSVPAPHLRALSIGGSGFGLAAWDGGEIGQTGRLHSTAAAEMVVPKSLDHRIARLVTRELIPGFQSLQQKPYLDPGKAYAPFWPPG